MYADDTLVYIRLDSALYYSYCQSTSTVSEASVSIKPDDEILKSIAKIAAVKGTIRDEDWQRQTPNIFLRCYKSPNKHKHMALFFLKNPKNCIFSSNCHNLFFFFVFV